MSWSIKLIGKRNDVKHAVEADTHIPACIKNIILDHLKPEPTAPNGVRVEGYGHYNGGDQSYRSSIGKLEVEPIDLIPEQPEPSEDVA